MYKYEEQFVTNNDNALHMLYYNLYAVFYTSKLHNEFIVCENQYPNNIHSHKPLKPYQVSVNINIMQNIYIVSHINIEPAENTSSSPLLGKAVVAAAAAINNQSTYTGHSQHTPSGLSSSHIW